MRRIVSVFLSVVMLCGLFVASVIAMPEATPSDAKEHPLVGSWLLDTDTADPENPMTLAVFTSDGVYLQVEQGEAGAIVGLGSWEPTGDTTANMTFYNFDQDGMIVIRASIESLDGQSLTAEYTVEFVDANGTSSGEIGPGMVEGTRIPVEPSATPVGSFEDVFGPFEEGTPAG